MLPRMMRLLLLAAMVWMARPAWASLSSYDAVRSGGYYINGINGFFFSPAYTTGIQTAFGQETRGLLAFDVSALPAGTIQSAVLKVQNPYSQNDLGGPLELKLYGLPGMSWSNHTGSSYLNASNFNFIGSSATPLWGTALVPDTSWPGSTVSFALPVSALQALRDAADGVGLYRGDFFAFGFRVVLADVQEPKPLQYVFGGTSSGTPLLRLEIDVVPAPEPRASSMFLLTLGLVTTARLSRRRLQPVALRPCRSRAHPLALAAMLGLAVFAIVPGTLSAATMNQSFNQTLKLGDNLPGGLDSATLSANRFNPALGSLSGVSFTLSSDFSGGAVFYHPSLSLDFTYTPRHYVAVEMDGLANAPSLILDHALPTQTYTDTAPGGGSYWVASAQEHFDQGLVVPSDELAQLIGTSPFSLTVTIEDRGLYAASNPLAYINDKFVISSLVLTIAYDYTPLPEPMSSSLVFAELGLSCLACRRRLR